MKKNFSNKGESSKKEEIIYNEFNKPKHMKGEYLEFLNKYQKERLCKPKVLMATWSNEDEDSSEDLDDQVANLCLTTHDSETTKVNFELEFILSDQWEETHETLYEKI